MSIALADSTNLPCKNLASGPEDKGMREQQQKFIDAVRHGNVPDIESALVSLLPKDADKQSVNIRRDIINYTEDRQQGGNALYWAIREGHLAAMHYLFKNGADENILCKKSGIAFILPKMMGYGSIETIRLALDHGANIEECEGTSHFTPLQIAARFGKTAIAELLLQRGANIVARGASSNAIHERSPAMCNAIDVMEEMDGSFDSKEAVTKPTPLFLAIAHTHQDTVELLKIYLALDAILKQPCIALMAIKVSAEYLARVKNDFEFHREPHLLQQTIDHVAKCSSTSVVLQHRDVLAKALTDLRIFDFEIRVDVNSKDQELKGLKEQFSKEIQRSQSRKSNFEQEMQAFISKEMTMVLAANFKERLICYFRVNSIEAIVNSILNPSISEMSLGKYYSAASAKHDVIQIQQAQISHLKAEIAEQEALSSKGGKVVETGALLMIYHVFQRSAQRILKQSNEGSVNGPLSRDERSKSF